MGIDFGFLNSFFTSNSIYFLGFGCFLGSQAKNVLKKSNAVMKLVAWTLLTVYLIYKSYNHVSTLPNKMKLFGMEDQFNSTKFKSGYKALMQKLHPDTSGFDSSEEFGEVRRFYEAISEKVQPEKLWSIYVMFGDEFNIHSDDDVKK